MNDQALYVRFSRTDHPGTRLVVTRGYNGPEIARLLWGRILTPREESDLDMAVREGAMEAANGR